MAEPRVLIGGKFAFDFVIQSSSPKKLLQGLKSVLCCKTSPKKTTKGFCRLDILSSSSTKKSFPKVTLGDTISRSRSGLLQSFLGQAHEGCHSSAQCPFALDPASDKFSSKPKFRKLVSWRIPIFCSKAGKECSLHIHTNSSFRKLYFDTVELQANWMDPTGQKLVGVHHATSKI